jgi:hypothetical protein
MNGLKATIAAAVLFCATGVAKAEVLCADKATVDEVKPIPQSLAAFANTLFGEDAASGTVYRCIDAGTASPVVSKNSRERRIYSAACACGGMAMLMPLRLGSIAI